MRYAGQKRRATTSKKYAMNQDYNKALNEAKKLHREDNEFYIDNINGYYTSVAAFEVKAYNYNLEELEHWIFNQQDKRWGKAK